MDILDEAFFDRKATQVAPELLGKFLVVRKSGAVRAHMITETEAYVGPHDLACHASKGRTPRTEPMFGKAGQWYVYFIYGMYDMLNIVTGPSGHPAAVLIRGVELYGGPGKLTRGLNIDRRINGMAASRRTGVWIEDRGFVVPRARVQRTPRIGIAYAGEPWVSKPWRYVYRAPTKTAKRRPL